MSQWLSLALERAVLRRAIRVMAVVGTILMTINYGDIIIAGELESQHIFKIALTYLVPFMVSTYSSVAARLDR